MAWPWSCVARAFFPSGATRAQGMTMPQGVQGWRVGVLPVGVNPADASGCEATGAGHAGSGRPVGSGREWFDEQAPGIRWDLNLR